MGLTSITGGRLNNEYLNDNRHSKKTGGGVLWRGFLIGHAFRGCLKLTWKRPSSFPAYEKRRLTTDVHLGSRFYLTQFTMALPEPFQHIEFSPFVVKALLIACSPIILLLTAYFFLVPNVIKDSRRRRLPPGPKGLPFVGSMFWIAKEYNFLPKY